MEVNMSITVLLTCAFLLKENPLGSLNGQIMDQDNTSVYGVTLTLENKLFSRTITVDEKYALDQIPVGTYRLEAVATGFKTLKLADIEILEGQAVTQDLVLEIQALDLKDRVVAPSSFSILNRPQGSSQYLDRETVRKIPRLGDDILRALDTLPGTSSNDFGAAFNIRGGEYREVLFQLDGMELTNPFHLKDYAGVFSFLDGEAIGSLELNTGGFDATYGNAMSGVLNVTSSQPVERRSSASLSFGGASFATEGTFNDGMSSYVFSGRRGYLDLLLSFAGGDEEEEGVTEDQDVTYYDTYGKLTHIFNPNLKWSVHYLLAADQFLNQETGGIEHENYDSDYDDFYLWTNLDTVINDRFSGRTTLYTTTIDRNRFAESLGDETGDDFRISDVRSNDRMGLKSHWEYATDKLFLRFGGEYREVDAAFDYESNVDNGVVVGGTDSFLIDTDLSFTGEEYNLFATGRFMLGDKVTTELGLRYDHQSFLSESQVSPRLNISWQPNDRHTFRFAYGDFYQAEQLHELQVADGVKTFSKPEHATHFLLGYETTLPNNISFRAETYYKDLKDLRTRYANLTKSLVFYPGVSGDRVAIDAETGQSYGAEFVLKQDRGQGLSWFLNYAYAKAEDTLADGRKVARPWEQRHTLNVSANYRIGKKWNFNASWIYHTGWRTTPFTLQEIDGDYEVVAGDWFSDNFPAYHRMDLRINRSVFSRGQKAFEMFIDISNLYNRKNQRGYDFYGILDTETGPAIDLEREDWLPILPSFGVNWRF